MSGTYEEHFKNCFPKAAVFRFDICIDILPCCNCFRHVHDVVNSMPVIVFAFGFYYFSFKFVNENAILYITYWGIICVLF